jgi:hypothetical protein
VLELDDVDDMSPFEVPYWLESLGISVLVVVPLAGVMGRSFSRLQAKHDRTRATPKLNNLLSLYMNPPPRRLQTPCRATG